MCILLSSLVTCTDNWLVLESGFRHMVMRIELEWDQWSTNDSQQELDVRIGSWNNGCSTVIQKPRARQSPKPIRVNNP